MDHLTLEPTATTLLREVEQAVGPLPKQVRKDIAREALATGRALSADALAGVLISALPELESLRAQQRAMGERLALAATAAATRDFDVERVSAVDFLAQESRRVRAERDAQALKALPGFEAARVGKAPAAGKSHSFSVLHVNDSHSNLSNLARMATLIKEARKIDPNIIVIHGGDAMVGTPLHELEPRGSAELEILRALGVQVFVVGNHDLDDGPQALAKALEAYPELQVIAANWTASGPLAKRLRTHAVLKVGDAKVAIVGLSVDPAEYGEISGTIKYERAEGALNELLPKILNTEKPDALLAATHHGSTRDVELAGKYPAVNGWNGGHDHRYFTRPQVVTHPDGSRSVVSEAGSSWERAAFTRYEIVDGKIKSVKGSLVDIDETIAPDPDMEKLIASYRKRLAAYDKVIATSTNVVSGKARTPDTRLGNYVTDMLRSEFTDKYGPIDIGIFNKTGLRASIPKGDISLWTMYELFPFPNTAALTDLTGKQVQQMLDNAARRDGDPISGVTYTLDGDKAVDIKVGGQPLDLTKTYRVITNDFLIKKGGSGYTVLMQGKNTTDTGVTIRDMLSSYLERVGKVDAPSEVEERTFVKPGTIADRIRKILGLSSRAAPLAA